MNGDAMGVESRVDDVEAVFTAGYDDPMSLRRAYSHVPSAVALLAAEQRGAIVGMTVATLLPVSLHPPLLGVMIQGTSSTWPELAQQPRIGVSVLAEDQSNVARQVASPARDRRFEGLELFAPAPDSSARLVRDASSWYETELVGVSDAGDHLFAQLSVHGALISRRHQPLVFHQSRFRRVAGGLAEMALAWPLDGVWQ